MKHENARPNAGRADDDTHSGNGRIRGIRFNSIREVRIKSGISTLPSFKISQNIVITNKCIRPWKMYFRDDIA